MHFSWKNENWIPLRISQQSLTVKALHALKQLIQPPPAAKQVTMISKANKIAAMKHMVASLIALYPDETDEIIRMLQEKDVGFPEPKKAKRASTGRLSGFMIFSAEMRPKVVEEMKASGIEKISQPDVARKLGSMWKALDDDQKKVYNDKSKAPSDKEAENNESPSDGEAPVKKQRLSKKSKGFIKYSKDAAIRNDAAIDFRDNSPEDRSPTTKELNELLWTRWVEDMTDDSRAYWENM